MTTAGELILGYMPRFFTQKSIMAFLVVLMLCSVVFFNRMLPPLWIAFGLVEVAGFFFFLNKLTRSWNRLAEPRFQKKLFWTALWIRVLWVFFSYYFYTQMWGDPFEFEAGDSKGYHGEALWLLGLLRDNKWNQYVAYIGKNYSDMGYPLYLGFMYRLFGESLLVPRLIKALLGSLSCVFIYRLARNNFGEAAGRMAGIMALLLPNLIYYTGLHLKETEMVFLVVYFLWVADRVIRSRQLRLMDLVLMSVLAGALFFFRTVLAVCLIGSVAAAAVFTSNQITGKSKRLMLLMLLTGGVVLLAMTPLAENIDEYFQNSDSNISRQMRNYAQYRQEGKNNKLAVYGSRSVFLPLMLMAPFPTLVNIADQQNAMMMGGAYFIRNAYAFFVFVALVMLYRHKKLRQHMLLLAFAGSYIFVLASSGFALSERFHLPLLPALLAFAGYGISKMNLKNKKYFPPYLVLVGLLVIGWNWFKIAGRS